MINTPYLQSPISRTSSQKAYVYMDVWYNVYKAVYDYLNASAYSYNMAVPVRIIYAYAVQNIWYNIYHTFVGIFNPFLVEEDEVVPSLMHAGSIHVKPKAAHFENVFLVPLG